MRLLLLICLGSALLGSAVAQPAQAQKHLPKSGSDPFAPKAQNARKLPPPKPTEVPTAYEADRDRLVKLDSAMWPKIEEAKQTLKDVHKRWNKSLPKGDQLFVTVRVYDDKGNFEHVLCRVDKWVPNRIFGTIASVLATTNRYKPGEVMSFEQTIVVDWKIKHADGSEEGNYVAKFLDEYYTAQTGKAPETPLDK